MIQKKISTGKCLQRRFKKSDFADYPPLVDKFVNNANKTTIY